MAEELLADYRRELADVKRERDDLKKALDTREDDNKTARDKIKALETKVEGLEKLVPSEGVVVLSKADAVRWQTFQDLGTVDEVSEKVKRTETAELRLSARDREDSIVALGFKPSVFEVIAQGAPFKAEGSGKDRQVLISVKKDDKTEDVELTELAKNRDLGDLLGVMGVVLKDDKPNSYPPLGAGTKQQQKQKPADADEVYQEKLQDNSYKM